MAEATGDSVGNLFFTGEWSDLQVVTKTKVFYVHKCIVCPKSNFFQAACTRDFEEARTGQVRVEEEERVVHDLLAHIYDIKYEAPETEDLETDYDRAQAIKHIVTVNVAADKYGIDGFIGPTSSFFTSLPRYFKSLKDVAQLASWIYDHDILNLGVQRQKVLDGVRAKISDFVDNDAAWSALYENEAFFKALMKSLHGKEKKSVKRKL